MYFMHISSLGKDTNVKALSLLHEIYWGICIGFPWGWSEEWKFRGNFVSLKNDEIYRSL